jgi:hypothetical protein
MPGNVFCKYFSFSFRQVGCAALSSSHGRNTVSAVLKDGYTLPNRQEDWQADTRGGKQQHR